MPLTQQLNQDLQRQSGTLTVTAAPGNLAELIALATELQHRPNVTTNGTITQLPPPPPPIEDEEPPAPEG